MDCPKPGCEEEEAGEAEGSTYDEEDEEDAESDTPTHVSRCKVCDADKDEECREAGGGGDKCPFADGRRKAIAKVKAGSAEATATDKKAAKGAVGDAKLPKAQRQEFLKRGHVPGFATTLTEKDLKRLDVKELVYVPAIMILAHRALWRPWLWGKPVKDRAGAFEALKKGIQKKYELEEPTTAGRITTLDRERAQQDFEELTEILDPAGGQGPAAVLRRLDKVIDRYGVKMQVYKTARKEGWKIARTTERIVAGEADTDKTWTESAALARRRVDDETRRQGRGGAGRGGNGRGRGGRG